MSEVKKICFDRILPRDLRRISPSNIPGTFRMAVLKSKKWLNASTLRISFLEGTDEQVAIVKQFAPQWCQYADLRFEFNHAADAEIRIAFRPDDGAWSYIGTDCRDIPVDHPTMNLGWQDEGVVLHEFGHAVGLIHEHQNPLGGIQWNKPQVYKDLGGPPNSWPKEVVDSNMFATYSVDQINGTELDKKSIMLYAIPTTWTLDGFHSEPNEKLSQTDKEFIGSEKNYPRAAANQVTVDGPPTCAEIGLPGEQDTYEFTTVRSGMYTIETQGPTDVVVSVYGPQSQTQPIAEDDDSGTERNAKLTLHLDTSTYRIQVRHFNSESGKGKYTVRVATAAAQMLRKAKIA
jgi:hypothetical protein